MLKRPTTAIAAFVVGLSGGACCAWPWENPFPFKSYERVSPHDANVADAKRDLTRRVPIGSPLIAYETLFQHSGGRCEVYDGEHRMACRYSHASWLLVTTDWICFVEFDPKTRASTEVSLDYFNTSL
jgi:hypothetical protein